MTAGGLARKPRPDVSARSGAKPVLATSADRRVRVMMLLGDLNGGGAERVALTLLNRCDPAAVDMRIGIMRRAGSLLGTPEPDRLTALAQWPRTWTEAIGTPGQVADLIAGTDPHVVMSFGMGVDALMWPALRLLGRRAPRWICRQDSNPDAEIVDLGTGPVLRWIVTRYMRAIQGSAHARVAVSSDLAAKADRGSRWSGLASQVIHNPLDLAQIERDAARPLPVTPVRPFVVAAGRLVHQKGYDLLIRAFADSVEARGMELIILGEGPLGGVLRAQAATLGVADRVRFPGYQDNPWAWFARARLAVLPSRWEGFGNVVSEAMACGAPTLVTDCDFGPREQVAHGINGWVVKTEDPAALTRGLDTILGDPDLARRLAAGGKERAQDFAIDPIVEAYTALFLEQGARGRHAA